MATPAGTPPLLDHPATGSILSSFHPFGVLHAGAVVVGALLVLAVVWAGRRAQRHGHEERVRAGWIGASLVVQAASIIYYALPANLDLSESLPLHVCDLAGPIAIAALWTRVRILRTLLYFWGIGLSSQAFFTPVLEAPYGLETLRFWLFFGTHLQIVGSAVYDLAVLRFRPAMPDFVRGSLVTMGYVGVMLPLNIATGWNYGYVGQTTPANPTPLDLLGTWPLRLLWLALICHGVFLLMTLVWRLAPRTPSPRDS